MSEREILAYLEQDKTIRIDMIEAIRRGTAAVKYAETDAVLLKTDSGFYLLVGDTVEACERALDAADDTFYAFVAHNEASREAVQKRYPQLNHCSPCWQAYCPKTDPIPVPDVCEIKPFPLDQVPFLVSVYDPGADPKDYEECVESGDVLAAYRDGKIAGFIGFHEDGSGGMLEVLPEFRRLGIGSALEIALHNLALSRGWTPYGQIRVGNEASRRLQESLGMIVSDPAGSILYWIYQED